MIVIGVRNSEGVYESRPFNNIIFHCTGPFSHDNGIGSMVKTFKVKYSIVTEILGKPPTVKELETLIGKEITCFYDEYKNVAYVEGLK